MRIDIHSFGHCENDSNRFKSSSEMEVLTFILLLTAGVVTYVVFATLRSIFWPPKAVPYEYAPQQVGSITLEELSKCNGLDPTRPILFSVGGKIYDVTESRDFYGPGGAYHVFAGREIARALGKMAIEEAECRGDIEDLTPRELSILKDWVDKFDSKYTVVGEVRDVGQIRCGYLLHTPHSLQLVCSV